ncbi:DMT family transporter [Shimia marina]|uniref:Carboxylate/amino acid/amine transporter n=1 Tax=Shimia marina TaxID=321267 RepID=A0A0P1EM42_9RHOB|nr:DMT family transporter [Shimia marina]CUH51343.1 carboxylate/amino acid/amine transporter [Shimia marina]SFD51532.1 S-adenosylmethionine uptake transporter [Shimia marina]
MNFKATLLALLAFAIYSTHDMVVKHLGASFSPFQIVFFSSLFSFPLITLMLVRDPTHGNLRPVHPWWVALRSLCIVIAPTAAFYAFSTLPLAQVYALLFSAPLLITVLSIPILGEKVGVFRLVAVLVGLCGVLVVVRPGATSLNGGHLAAMLAASAVALQSVIVRKIGREERRVVLMLYPLLISVAVMSVAMSFAYEPVGLSDLAGFAIVAVFGFVATLLMVVAYTWGEAALVAPMQYSQIIWAVIFGMLFFGETPDVPTLLGAGIIVASGLFIIAREATGGTSEQTPVLRTRSRGISPGSLRVSQAMRRPTRSEKK